MSCDSIPQVLVRQPDSVKLSKPKPPILSPSIDSKVLTPNKKNFVSVRKLNSSFAATGGSQEVSKIPPKKQLISQAALSNLPEKISTIPPSPKFAHRKYENQSQKFEIQQVETNSNDVQISLSKLAINNREYSSEANNQVQEDFSDNSSIDYSNDNSLFKSNPKVRKRKLINSSGSFDLSRKSNIRKIHSSYSFMEFQKKVSKSPSHTTNILQNESISSLQDFEDVHSISSKLSLLPNKTEEQMITIQFTSNWGNPKVILLSTVTVMDAKKKNIPIKTISSVPDLPNINLLEKFADHKLVKQEDDVFPIDIDLTIKEKFSLILEIDKSANPKFVRIWNPTLQDESLASASVKNATIYLNHLKVGEGEIPQNFGIDIELKDENSEMDKPHQFNSSLLIDELFPAFKAEEKIFDTYGIYPFNKTCTITMEVLSTYKNNPEKIELVGLNGIDFYDDKGKKLRKLDFNSISVRNILISSYANPRMIVRDSMITCSLDYQFLGNYQPDLVNEQNQNKLFSSSNPLFIFTLKDPTSLSMMRIWNFNSIDEELENGIQKVIIRNNDKIVWSGKVKKGSGLINGIERSVTDIWFTDSMVIREHVSRHLLSNAD